MEGNKAIYKHIGKEQGIKKIQYYDDIRFIAIEQGYCRQANLALTKI